MRTPERYVAEVTAGGDATAVSEELDAETRAAERLQLALRTRTGVGVDELVAHRRVGGGDASAIPREIDELVTAGLLRRVADGPAGDRVVLTPEGRMMANAVSTTLI